MSAMMMIDLETLDVKPSAVVLSCGWVVFSPNAILKTGVSVFNNQQEQIDAGRTINYNTVKWWIAQSQEAQKRNFKANKVDKTNLVDMRNDWLNFNCQELWAWGSDFDISILTSYLQFKKRQTWWPYNKVRCARTLCKIAGVDVDRAKGVHHDALDDSRAQVEAVQNAMRKIVK